ncbi:MAG: mechanosensitive ion channel family protein [bacterium]
MKFLDQLKSSLGDLWSSIADTLPKLLVALIGFIVAILVIKVLGSILKRILLAAKINRLDEKINKIELVEGKSLNVNLLNVILKTFKWFMYFVLFMVITEILELTMLSEGLKSLLGYLPQLITAVAIFTIGLLFANFVKTSLKSLFESMDLSGGKAISQMVFFILLIFIGITALNQAGVDTTIITSNVTLIFGALLAAFTLAFGLGARNVIGDMLRMYYTRRRFEIGQKIKFLDKEGVIESVDDLSLTLKTKKGLLIVPIKDITENQVEIQGK